MRKLIVVLLALATAALANSAFAVATWEYLNADPAYHSREAAIADAPRVLRQAGYPEPVISLLTEAMKNPGTEAHVTNGMRFDFMRSGKSALWRNVVVKFSKPPRESEKNMELSAPSEEWTVEWNGGKWTAGIPKVCNNIYGRRPVTPAPVPPVAVKPPPATAQPPAKQLIPTPTAVCPKGIVLFANGWTMDAIYAASNDLGKRVDALIAAATKRDSENASNVKAYAANDVSGGNIGDGVSENIGDEIIRVVNVRAPLGIDIQVNLLDPVTTKVVEDLGKVPLVDGVAKIYLTEAQRAYIVETIWPAWFSSPTVSGGERRIWVLPGAWNKKGGKNWHWCTLEENAAYWIVNRP